MQPCTTFTRLAHARRPTSPPPDYSTARLSHRPTSPPPPALPTRAHAQINASARGKALAKTCGVMTYLVPSTSARPSAKIKTKQNTNRSNLRIYSFLFI